jgi:hypothetical protein
LFYQICAIERTKRCPQRLTIQATFTKVAAQQEAGIQQQAAAVCSRTDGLTVADGCGVRRGLALGQLLATRGIKPPHQAATNHPLHLPGLVQSAKAGGNTIRALFVGMAAIRLARCWLRLTLRTSQRQ